MTDAIVHRGPDSDGHWLDASVGIALGHRRLSIIDLSAAGAQPMSSSSGRFVIVYNGEIYNNATLRARLDLESSNRASWTGHSDTETLLAAIERWGLSHALEQCVGMFAFALWDRRDRVLSLARDRIGEKPLYFGYQGGNFLFASELKAIRQAAGFEGRINPDVVGLYFQYGAVPDPYCIYSGMHKLRPGTILSLSESDLRQGVLPTATTYWSLAEVAERGRVTPFSGSDAEAVSELHTLFARAISEQSVADVPLGAFLSGGVDSSAVVAMMQAQSSRRVKTFTMGFSAEGYDEAGYARAVAQHLGTDHHELYVSPEDARAVIPMLPAIYDEPFADSSQIPTWLVSRLARTHVTVSLSGDGGDELFGGYGRYQLAQRVWSHAGRIPRPVRRGVARGVRAVSASAWDELIDRLRWTLPGGLGTYASGSRLHKLAAVLDMDNMEDFYSTLVTHWPADSGVVRNARCLPSVYGSADGLSDALTGPARLMAKDILGYLATDILVKVDRASMANSLESRVPLLDHRIVEFAQTLPTHFKMRGPETKWVLRQLLYRYVPRELIDRPKMGFGIPLGAWLRGPLRDWAESLLRPSELAEDGYLNPVPIVEKWRQHLAGTHDWESHLWDVLMFQAWRKSL